MNPYLDEDLVALGEQARRFATARIAPGFAERDRTRVLDRTLMKAMGEMGFIAPELPEEFGGLGLGCLAAGVIHEEIARADLSISYINLLASLNGQILSHHGRPEVVKPWLARLTRGEALFAIALTEPRGGSDAAQLRLRVERVGDDYVVNGEKTSISAGDQADADPLRCGQRGEAAAVVSAEELEHEWRDCIQSGVRQNHFAVEPLPPQEPNQPSPTMLRRQLTRTSERPIHSLILNCSDWPGSDSIPP